MSNPVKSMKERTKRLIDLELCNTIRMKLIIDRAIDGLNLMIADKIKKS